MFKMRYAPHKHTPLTNLTIRRTLSKNNEKTVKWVCFIVISLFFNLSLDLFLDFISGNCEKARSATNQPFFYFREHCPKTHKKQ